jgi:hypothetical protein
MANKFYLFMDVYSRKIVGWQVYERESSESIPIASSNISKALGNLPRPFFIA